MIDKITVEVLRHNLEYIAERVAVTLRRCAFSPNIRDRADLSCLIASADGEIVVQAEHIPVHLGSLYVGMKEFLRYIREEGLEPEPGDVYVVNDPYIIGTHLNDVTLLAPVFYQDKHVAWVVVKAHYVDIGGVSPGGLSMRARSLYEEGLVIPPSKIVEQGKLRKDLVNLILSNVRVPDVIQGDLMAHIAACRVGVEELTKLIDKYGITRVEATWKYLIDLAEKTTREKVSSLRGEFYGEDYIELPDRLVRIAACVVFTGSEVVVDYSESSDQVEYPLNAVLGVTYASTTFVFRTLLGEDILVNEGFYRVIRIRTRKGTIVDPVKPAPVGLGNVETSQRIVDVLYNALEQAFPDRVPAQSGGTMTNVVLSGLARPFVFYETIGCGAGARPGMDGEDAVHVYMTNTLNTPIEVIEKYYPVLFTRYEIRRGSGGKGRWRGGDGIVRAFKVLEPCRLCIVMDRVRIAPRGRKGGLDAMPGRVRVVKPDGRVIELSGKDEIVLEPGDEVIIETPGGGGYEPPEERSER